MFGKKPEVKVQTIEELLQRIRNADFSKPQNTGPIGDLDLNVVKTRAEAAEEDLILIIDRNYFAKTHKPKAEPTSPSPETRRSHAEEMEWLDYSKSSLE